MKNLLKLEELFMLGLALLLFSQLLEPIVEEGAVQWESALFLQNVLFDES